MDDEACDVFLQKLKANPVRTGVRMADVSRASSFDKWNQNCSSYFVIKGIWRCLWQERILFEGVIIKSKSISVICSGYMIALSIGRMEAIFKEHTPARSPDTWTDVFNKIMYNRLLDSSPYVIFSVSVLLFRRTLLWYYAKVIYSLTRHGQKPIFKSWWAFIKHNFWQEC